MQKIIFLQGLPASGKTTYAIDYCNKNPDFRRLNKDDIREEFGNPPWSKDFEKRVLNIQRTRGLEFLNLGFSIIIDDTNFSKIHSDFWSDVAHRRSIEFVKKYFDTPVDECIRRDSLREKSVGIDVILSMYKKYCKNDQKVFTDTRFILKQNKELPRCIICDLDGTLCLINNRSPYDNEKVINDKLNYPVYNILKNYYNLGIKIIFMSGRSELARENTETWMKNNLEFYNSSHSPIMRSANDNRSDEIIKSELYNTYIKDKYYVEFVLDDRDSVVKHWRNLGLLCLQVYYGDF